MAGSLEVGGVTRTYQAHLPVRTGPAPMIIALHGKGGSATEMAETTALTETAAEQGMGVAYPDRLLSRLASLDLPVWGKVYGAHATLAGGAHTRSCRPARPPAHSSRCPTLTGACLWTRRTTPLTWR